ncbi:MAG: hypothetical protein JKY94_10935 [Rhodobacteraceae bacterium]|nr:hypothetical protein [Paracoccaceae bacterium]
MKVTHAIMLIGLGLSVSACASVDVPTRNTPFEQLPTSTVMTPDGFELVQPANSPSTDNMPATVKALQATQVASTNIIPGQTPVTVNSIIVHVPRSLKVSEANRYIPSGDIVWRGDPIGNRHLQVRQIFETAMLSGVRGLNGQVTVDVDIEVMRFHALTEKARYSVGGVHSITFKLALKNPETGALLVPVRIIRADLDGFGGSQALAAEARGQTQKVRITDHLAEVIRQELTNPEGYQNANLGFLQMLNGL